MIRSHSRSHRHAPSICRATGIFCITLLLTAGPVWAGSQQKQKNDLTDLSIEALMEIEVTSVSRKSQPLANTAAAVVVISQEDIRRSGATTIPDLLRM